MDRIDIHTTKEPVIPNRIQRLIFTLFLTALLLLTVLSLTVYGSSFGTDDSAIQIHGFPDQTDNSAIQIHGFPAQTDDSAIQIHGFPAQTDDLTIRLDNLPVQNNNLPFQTDNLPVFTDTDSGNLEPELYYEEQDADVNIGDNSQSSNSLFYYLSLGDLDSLKCLVQNGANVNARNNQGKTPLDLTKYDDEIHDYLIKHGAEHNPTTKFFNIICTLIILVILAFFIFRRFRNIFPLSYIEKLIKNAYRLFKKYWLGNSLIHAIERGDMIQFQRLVELGADVNAKDSNGQSVLSYAARGGNLDLIKYLIDNGADVKAKDNNGMTILHKVAENGNLEVIQYLVERGADINAQTNDRRTVLQRAAWKGNLELVQWLVQMGADVNAKGGMLEESVLHYAAQRECWNVVEWLVEKGADVNAKNILGETVMDYAVRSENPRMVNWLKEHGAK